MNIFTMKFASILLFLLPVVMFTQAQPGTIDQSFNATDAGFDVGSGANNIVYATVMQPDGKVIIGGSFTTYNGIARNGIARLNTDGSLDVSFNPGFGALGGEVRTIALQPDGKIIIGGGFSSFNGTSRSRIARLNVDGTLDASFNIGGGASGGPVYSIALQSDGKIVIGGFFTAFNSVSQNYIARLNADGVLDTGFNPGTGANSRIWAVAVQPDGKILIGGEFTSYNGTVRNRFARLNIDGTLDAGFNTGGGASGSVFSISLQSDGKIIIGGNFSHYQNTIRRTIARLNADGTLDQNFNTGEGANFSVQTVAVQPDGKIIIGGDFTIYNGTTRRNLARLNTNGTLDATLDPGTGPSFGPVYAIALQTNGKVLIGGRFTSFNGTARNNITRVNADATLDASFNYASGANGTVSSIVMQPDGKILIGGQFTIYNGSIRNYIARLNTNGTLDAAFNSGTGANDSVTAIALQPDGKILIVGNFTSYNGIARSRIARLNADGTLDASFNPGTGADYLIQSIALQPDGKIIIGGYFGIYNGNTRPRIARLNADGSVDAGFSPASGPNNLVLSIALQTDGKILIGGDFTYYHGTVRNRIARLHTNGTLDLSFNPSAGANNRVHSVAIQSDDKILIGGEFTSFRGISRSYIARLNTDGTLDAGNDPGTGANGPVRSLVLQLDGKIIIGGDFTSYNGSTRNRLARLNADLTLDWLNPGTGPNVYIRSLALQPDGKILIGGKFTSYNGTGRNRMARVQGGTWPAPTIGSFTPTRAVTGTSITINGTNFTGASAVRFGGTDANSFTVVSSTRIVAVLGTGGSGDVYVETSGGSATRAGFNYTGITSFTPTSATFGQTVTINGSNLTGTTAVTFGGVPATSFNIVSASQITAVVGIGASGNIALTTPVGVTTRSGFTYLFPPPTISGFTPASAANRDRVTITGNHFTGATAVRFGGTNAYAFTVINNNTIEAIVGLGNSGNVTVVTPGGTANSAGFTFVPTAPSISSFSPATACSTSTTITIRGLNFTGTSSVQVGGVSTAFTLLSDTVITFVTGATNNSGPIRITTPAGSGTSATNLIMGTGIPAFTPIPNPFQLCAGSTRVLNTSLAGTYNYVCSNGQSGNTITISAPGNYTLSATDEYGCTGSTSFTVANYPDCAGYLDIEATPVINYFDTLTVRVRTKNAVNIFSAFAYLNFNTSQLKYIGAQPGNFFGSNVLHQPPVVSGGQIDFGTSLITGAPGVNGDGLIYEFRFVLADQIPNIAAFNAIKPNFFASTITLSNIRVRNALGLLPPSFDAISTKSKAVACRYYVPVWPGDLNFDRRVTVADVLPIGYFYGGSGLPRPDGSFVWKAQPSALWGFDKTTKSSSAYRTFADGEPDGIINLADQASIGFNLNRIRLNNEEDAPGEPSLTNIDPNLPPVTINMPRAIIASAALPVNEVGSITLGSGAKPLNNVYGIAFDIFFNPAFVNPNAITTSFVGSIFGTEGVNFTKIEDRTAVASGRLSVGITRFNSTGFTASGGEVMKITFPFIAGGPGGNFKITVVPIAANNPTGADLSVTGSEQTIQVGSAICTTNTWTGAVSTAWENVANWSCNAIPNANTPVVVPANVPRFPVIRSMAECRSMTTAPGASVRVDPGFRLDLKGVK